MFFCRWCRNSALPAHAGQELLVCFAPEPIAECWLQSQRLWASQEKWPSNSLGAPTWGSLYLAAVPKSIVQTSNSWQPLGSRMNSGRDALWPCKVSDSDCRIGNGTALALLIPGAADLFQSEGKLTERQEVQADLPFSRASIVQISERQILTQRWGIIRKCRCLYSGLLDM